MLAYNIATDQLVWMRWLICNFTLQMLQEDYISSTRLADTLNLGLDWALGYGFSWKKSLFHTGSYSRNEECHKYTWNKGGVMIIL